MKETRLGGIASILVGVLYLATVLIVLTAPPGKNAVEDHVTYMDQLVLVHYILGFAGLLGVMVVLSLSEKLKRYTAESEWYTYAKVMAIVGFSLLAVNNLRQSGLDHELSHDAVSKGGTVLDTIVMSWAGLVELSPQGWIDFGFVGVWILTAGYITWKNTKQKVQAIIGMAGGFCFILTVLGNVLGIGLFVQIGMGLGGILLIPLWFFLNGLTLLKKNSITPPTQISSSLN